MSDSNLFDNKEKIDILIKKNFGFPTTSENKEWYEEITINYNDGIIGDNLLLDKIPSIPDFDNGNVKTAEECNLTSSNFENYSYDKNNKTNASIVDDVSGIVRRFQNIVLERTPQLSSDDYSSWYVKDNSSNNVLVNSFQFNYNKYTDNNGVVKQPYLYKLYTKKSLSSNKKIPFGKKGGNWFIDVNMGVLFF